MIELTTARLRLTIPPPERAADALAYFTENQTHLSPTNPVLPPDFLTLGYWQKRLAETRVEFTKEQSARFFVELLDSTTESKMIGVINFTQFARGPFQACYLGYSIGHRVQGQGFMFEGLQRAIRFAFDELHFHRIMANYLTSNDRSAAVLKRMGFRIEGEAPKYLMIDGEWRTHTLTALTNDNWTPREQDRALYGRQLRD